MTRREDFGSDGALPELRAADWRMRYLQREGFGIEGRDSPGPPRPMNPTSIEVKFRRLQTIRPARWGEVGGAEGKGVGGKMSLEGQAAFSGASRSAAAAVVSPGPIEHVRRDVAMEAKSHKRMRLAREERPEAMVQLRVVGGACAVEQPPLGCYSPALFPLPGAGSAPAPLADAAARLRRGSAPAPYSDPLLRDQRCWSSFVQPLHGRRLADFHLGDGARAEIFFVGKKDGRFRMVADCRRSNGPLGVRLATGDAFGALDMADDGALLTVEGADLKGAFYQSELPEQLRSVFALRPAHAGALGVASQGGASAMASARLCPRRARAGGCDDAARLRDGRPAPPLGPAGHLARVGNFVSIGYDATAVRSVVARAMAELERRGQAATHEGHLGDNEGEYSFLGWPTSSAGRLSAAASRLRRARLAVRGLLRRGRASGRGVERALGRVVSVALARREGIGIFESCFRIARKCCRLEAPLWSQVGGSSWLGMAPPLCCGVTSALGAPLPSAARTPPLGGWAPAKLTGKWPLFERSVVMVRGGAAAGLSARLLVAEPTPLNPLPKAPQRAAWGSERRASALFDARISQRRRSAAEPTQPGQAARDHLGHLFGRGYCQTRANPMIAAVAWRGPRFAEAATCPWPSGWRKSGETSLFEIYGRPGEIRGLRLQDVAPPAAAPSGGRRYLSATPREQGASDVSRTGEFDAAVRLDLERQAGLSQGLLATAAARRRGGAPAAAPLSAVSQRELAGAWRDVLCALGLAEPAACNVNQLRRSGPNRDSAAAVRHLEQIRRRGRWKSWSSGCRCEKGAAACCVGETRRRCVGEFCCLCGDSLTPDMLRRLKTVEGEGVTREKLAASGYFDALDAKFAPAPRDTLRRLSLSAASTVEGSPRPHRPLLIGGPRDWRESPRCLAGAAMALAATRAPWLSRSRSGSARVPDTRKRGTTTVMRTGTRSSILT
ncbi:unnamed protein product [Prorocentrum cordatum]|uniref:Uncharacterized protein n=1 Tax=Prorocentrum cordatum TaxID=2364126 RepID=A0ABN9RDE1_9DINO|nr:unnamed protein product [Polarella glacialis]